MHWEHIVSPLGIQLAIKDSLTKVLPLFSRLYDFLKSLFKFHHNSNGVTAVFGNSVSALALTGACSLIRVDGTRWIQHVLNGLSNVLNALPAHLASLDAIISETGYGEVQKARAKFFKENLNDPELITFTCFMKDIVKTMAVISKVLVIRSSLNYRL